MAILTRQGGVWKDSAPSVRDGGAWKEVQEGYVRDGGTWKQFYSGSLTWDLTLLEVVLLVGYGGGRWAAVILAQDDFSIQVRFSTDKGTTWGPRVKVADSRYLADVPSSIAYDDDLDVWYIGVNDAFGSAGPQIYSSSDGTTWGSFTTPGFDQLYSLDYSQEGLLAAGFPGRPMRLSSGSWVSATAQGMAGTVFATHHAPTTRSLFAGQSNEGYASLVVRNSSMAGGGHASIGYPDNTMALSLYADSSRWLLSTAEGNIFESDGLELTVGVTSWTQVTLQLPYEVPSSYYTLALRGYGAGVWIAAYSDEAVPDRITAYIQSRNGQDWELIDPWFRLEISADLPFYPQKNFVGGIWLLPTDDGLVRGM